MRDQGLASTKASTIANPKLSHNLDFVVPYKSNTQPLCGFERTGKLNSDENLVAQKRELVQQALKLLFITEYHLLVEYVECIVPIMYSIYVFVLVHSPNAAYFPETRSMTTKHVQATANSILLYAGFEVMSIICLHYAIKRKFGFSPAYLLAFVLEN